MKNILKNNICLLLTLIFLMSLSSCKKSFLEVVPKGKLIATTTNDYNMIMNSSSFTNYTLATFYTALGDELIARDPFFGVRPLIDQRLFRYEDNIYNSDVDPSEIAALTKSLYLFNKVINEVMDSDGGSDDEKKAIRAEALTGRAWIYIHYTTLFTKPYNGATAATDLGFPLIAESDINKTPYSRPTLNKVYDFMINDLTAAIPDLSVTISSRHRASRSLAKSLLAKVYLAMGKYADALINVNDAINIITANTGVPARIYDYNIEMLAGGALYSASMGTTGPAFPTSPNNVESIYGKQDINSHISSANNYFVLSPEVAALYGVNDLRRKYYNATALTYPVGCLRRLAPIIQATGMNIPELYLMRAECRARANNTYGAGSAAEDLLFLRKKRMPAADAVIPIGYTQTQMIKYVIDERLRELAFTGMRWFDMRRLSIDPLFSGTTFTHKLYYSTGIIDSYILRPERFTMRIPTRILNDNPGLIDNQ